MKEVLTSKWFGSEDKFKQTAQRCGKMKEIDGIIYFEDPYKRKLRRKPPYNQLEDEKQIELE